MKTKASEVRRLKERIMELEAIVAMCEPPSPDKWSLNVCLSVSHEQTKIRRKLDRIAERMKAKGGEK